MIATLLISSSLAQGYTSPGQSNWASMAYSNVLSVKLRAFALPSLCLHASQKTRMNASVSRLPATNFMAVLVFFRLATLGVSLKSFLGSAGGKISEIRILMVHLPATR